MNEEILIPHTRLLLLLLVAVYGLIYGSPQNNEAAIDDEKFSENKWRGVNVNWSIYLFVKRVIHPITRSFSIPSYVSIAFRNCK